MRRLRITNSDIGDPPRIPFQTANEAYTRVTTFMHTRDTETEHGRDVLKSCVLEPIQVIYWADELCRFAAAKSVRWLRGTRLPTSLTALSSTAVNRPLILPACAAR